MQIPFHQLPPTSRLWIYHAERRLTSAEQQTITTELNRFCATWETHGKPITCGFRIYNHTLILLSVDEQKMALSGCAIDHSIHTMDQIGQQIQAHLLSRTQIPFVSTSNTVVWHSLQAIPKAIQEGTLTPRSRHYNITAPTKGEFETQPLMACEDSWIKRYISPSNKIKQYSVY